MLILVETLQFLLTESPIAITAQFPEFNGLAGQQPYRRSFDFLAFRIFDGNLVLDHKPEVS